MRGELNTKLRAHRRTFLERNVTCARRRPLISRVPRRLHHMNGRRRLPDRLARILSFAHAHLKRVATTSIHTDAFNFTFVGWRPGHGPRQSLMQLNVSLQAQTAHVFANWLQARLSLLFSAIPGRAHDARVASVTSSTRTSSLRQHIVGTNASFQLLPHTISSERTQVHTTTASLGRMPVAQPLYSTHVRQERPSYRPIVRQHLYMGRARERSPTPTDRTSIVVQPHSLQRSPMQQLTVRTHSSDLYRQDQQHHYYPETVVRDWHGSISETHHQISSSSVPRVPLAAALGIPTRRPSVTRSPISQPTARWLLLHHRGVHGGAAWVAPAQRNQARVVETTMPMVTRLVSRLSTAEHEIQHTSSSRVFAHQTQVVSSTVRSQSRKETDEEVRKHVQRLVQEATTRWETKLRATTSSAEDLTDRVYHHLTKRLQVEKERLGY